MTSLTFHDVWRIVSQIPAGRVATYGQIAFLLGHPRAARFVGFALHAAPSALPCHRVVSSSGRLSDAFEPFGRATHRQLLEMEGVPFSDSGSVNLSVCLWHPDDTQEV